MNLDDFFEALRRVVESRVIDIYSCLPGIVKDYDAQTQTATIIPAVRRPLPTADDPEAVAYEELPSLPNVRICFPQGGGCSVTFPIHPGDSVLLLFSSLSPSEWRATGAVSDATDVRPHSLGNAFAVPCVAPDATKLAHASLNALVLEAPTVKVGAGATDPIAKAPNLETMLAQIDTDLQALGVATGALITFTVLPIAATKGQVE